MREMIRLALPSALTSLGLMMMGVVDLLFVGRLGTTATGAVGIGTSFWAWFLVFGMGILAGLDYYVSSAFGAGRYSDCLTSVGQGIWIAILLSVPLMLLILLLAHNLSWFRIHPAIVPDASDYLSILSASLLPAWCFAALRNFLQAVGNARGPFFILLWANILNAVLNYMLIYGKWGAPALGVVGSAWATVIARTAMALWAVALVLRWGRRMELQGWLKLRWDRLREIATLGLPIGLQMLAEVGVFSVATALAGQLAPESLAAHQIVLNIASVTFMVPMGIAAATAVLVGRALGQCNRAEAVNAGWRGLALGWGFMFLSSAALVLFADRILSIYTTDSEVIALGKRVLLVAAFFQMSDGIQAVMSGALRGWADTKTAMVTNFLWHWLAGLPIGVLLCFSTNWGLQGMWTGLALGLTGVAVTLLVFWIQKTRHAPIPTLSSSVPISH